MQLLSAIEMDVVDVADAVPVIGVDAGAGGGDVCLGCGVGSLTSITVTKLVGVSERVGDTTFESSIEPFARILRASNCIDSSSIHC